MLTITVKELKANLEKYLSLSATEDVYVTRNGKTVAKLTAPFQDKLATVDSLFGSLADTVTLEESKEDRLAKL